MSGIKNFFVKGKPIKFQEKGIINYYRYLNDKKHQNHKGKTNKIYNIFNNDDFIKNAITSSVKLNLKKSLMKGKGGRFIKEFGHSFVFSPPKELKIDKKDWENLTKRILTHVFNYIKKSNPSITKKELLRHTFVNVHEEDISHLNFLFSKVIGGKPIHWSKYEINNIFKQEFNLFCLERGMDYKTYEPKKRKNGNNIYKSIKEKEKELNEKLEKLQDVKELEEKVKKYIKRMGTYIKRVIQSQKEHDKIKEEKNKNLIKKNINKIPTPQKNQINDILKEYNIEM